MLEQTAFAAFVFSFFLFMSLFCQALVPGPVASCISLWRISKARKDECIGWFPCGFDPQTALVVVVPTSQKPPENRPSVVYFTHIFWGTHSMV